VTPSERYVDLDQTADEDLPDMERANGK